MPFYQTDPDNMQSTTPPPTPLEQSSFSTRQPSRFRLPKLLKRSQSPGPEVTRPKAVEDIRTVSVNTSDIPPLPRRVPSPFRAVTHMKRPIPLLLPASPPNTPRVSISDPGKRPIAIRQHSADSHIPTTRIVANIPEPESNMPQRSLRAIPRSVPNLRAPPSLLPLQTQEMKRTLLPSPFSHDNTMLVSPTESCFTCQSATTRCLGIIPYEDNSIVSSYFDVSQPQNPLPASRPYPTKKQAEQSMLQDVPLRSHDTSIPQTVRSTVKLAGPPRRGSNALSSEGDWLSGTMQYCEQWLEGVETDPRRCQIVENPYIRSNPDDVDAETSVVRMTQMLSKINSNVQRNMPSLFKQQSPSPSL